MSVMRLCTECLTSWSAPVDECPECDDEQFCDACFAGLESSEHLTKCGE